jgi:hypothetical protein
MFDRLRVVACTAALFGAQYYRTGDALYFWLAFGVIAADLFRYLNGSQMAKMRRMMRSRLAEARGEAIESAPRRHVPGGVGRRHSAAGRGHFGSSTAESYLRARDWLQARPDPDSPGERRRVRDVRVHHRPLTGWVVGTTIVAGACCC